MVTSNVTACSSSSSSSSTHVRLQHFVPGVHFFSKKVDDLLVVALKIQLLTVTANAQNTLQHLQGRQDCPHLAGAHGSIGVVVIVV